MTMRDDKDGAVTRVRPASAAKHNSRRLRSHFPGGNKKMQQIAGQLRLQDGAVTDNIVRW
jgi:hypothetical protein